jgi:steroid delta-isomerase-like uncharacterized protein
MMTHNEQAIRIYFDGITNGDLERAVQVMDAAIEFRDVPSGQLIQGTGGVQTFLQGWLKAFSDGVITAVSTFDSGSVTTAEAVYQGTNDGPMGPMPATGKKGVLPFCTVFHFNAEGKIHKLETYYDMLGMFVQLGHLEAPVS